MMVLTKPIKTEVGVICQKCGESELVPVYKAGEVRPGDDNHFVLTATIPYPEGWKRRYVNRPGKATQSMLLCPKCQESVDICQSLGEMVTVW